MKNSKLAQLRERIAWASLKTEVSMQYYALLDSNEELTLKQKLKRGEALNEYIRNVFKEKELIDIYETAQDSARYESRDEELEKIVGKVSFFFEKKNI